MGRVDQDLLAVGAGAGVRVATPLALIFRRLMEMPERFDPAAGDVEKVRVLAALGVGIGVIEPTEIRSQPPTSVRAETIERMRQRAFRAAFHVQDMAKAACRSNRANGISARG